MFEETLKLEITQKELDVIEAALHTQSKILGVEASAGGKAALARLNDVKRTLAHVAQQQPSRSKRLPCSSGWFRMARMFS